MFSRVLSCIYVWVYFTLMIVHIGPDGTRRIRPINVIIKLEPCAQCRGFCISVFQETNGISRKNSSVIKACRWRRGSRPARLFLNVFSWRNSKESGALKALQTKSPSHDPPKDNVNIHGTPTCLIKQVHSGNSNMIAEIFPIWLPKFHPRPSWDWAPTMFWFFGRYKLIKVCPKQEKKKIKFCKRQLQQNKESSWPTRLI